MSNVVNWYKIVATAAALFLAEVLVGFIGGGLASSDLSAAKRLLVQSPLLSLLFSATIFSVMAACQDYRPFLHAGLALLLTSVFSLALVAILPDWLTDTPHMLAALEWLTLIVGLVIGTSIGRYILRRFRAEA
jgi:hypothetical protein